MKVENPFFIVSIFCFLIIFTFKTYAYVDFSVNYTYSKSVVNNNEIGSSNPDGKAVNTTEGVTIGWGWFIWDYTALEFNYAVTTNKVIDDRSPQVLGSDFTLLSVKNEMKTEIKGVGIRQALASRNSRIIPSLSLGYAQYTTSGLTTYFIDNGSEVVSLDVEQEDEIQSSSYAALQLRIRITEYMGLTFMARAVMPDFKTELAADNMTYALGFSWVF